MPLRSRRRARPAWSLGPTPLALSASLLLGLASCEVEANPAGDVAARAAAASGAREREAPLVRVAPVEEREMVQVLETTTVLESEYEVAVVPRTQGIVVELLREEGDRVEAGEVLARLDARDAELGVRDAEVAVEEMRNRMISFDLAIEEARAEIVNARLAQEQAQRDFERNDRLFGTEAELPSALSAQALEASRLELERSSHELVKAELALKRAEGDAREAEIALSRAEVALKRAELTREDHSIRAPISGVIASRSLRVGDTVGSEPGFVLTDTENLRAVFYRPQRELGLFTSRTNGRGGDGAPLEITATTEARPGSVYRGYIERASPTIDAESGSFRVTARMSITPEPEAGRDTDHLRLLPGMLVRLRIVTDRHPNALVVLKRSVRREGEDSFVLRVEGSLAHRVPVEEGFADDDLIEVVPLESGTLAAGDSIVTVGARDLADGSEVKVQGDEPEAEPASEPESSADDAGSDGDEAAE